VTTEPYAPPPEETWAGDKPERLSKHEAVLRLLHKLAICYVTLPLLWVALLPAAVVVEFSTYRGTWFWHVADFVVGALVRLGLLAWPAVAVALVVSGVVLELLRRRRRWAILVGILGLLSGGLLILAYLFVTRVSPGPERDPAGSETRRGP